MVLRRGAAIRRHIARITLGFVFLSLALGMPAPAQTAAAAAPELTVSKTGPGTVLAGDVLPYEITVHNAGSDGYNLSLRDVLPPGVKYAGPTTPTKLGEPRVIEIAATEDVDAHQVLVWPNISDLPATGTQTLNFAVEVDAETYPVGSVIQNEAEAYLSENPRIVPRFDANGIPVPRDEVSEAATTSEAQTRINPIQIDKTQPSPEHELMRGVHDQTTVYTLTVTNNDVAPTETVVVTDYLPAQLEFLGCGGVSNGGSEYGGRSVAATPAVDGCITPISVETVQLGAGDVDGIERAGIYTKVVWEVSDLSTGEKTEIKYAAGIPQRANAPFDADAPTPESLQQAANLDNNTGASTRELAEGAGGEQGLRNYATVEGNYTGPVASETDRAARDITHLDVTAEDLAIHKTSETDVFHGQSEVEYTLTIRTSEYVTTTDVVVTDVLPDGLCMAADADGTACATEASEVFLHNTSLPAGVTVSVTGLAYNATTGETTVTLTIDGELPPNSNFEIKYPAPTLSNYGGENKNQAPTVSGDEFTNNVSISGTTTSVAGINPPQSDAETIEEVADASSSTVRADFAKLTKTVGTNTASSGAYVCDADGVDFVSNDEIAADQPDLTFSKGDHVCFTVRVDFSEHNNTRNPVIRDFLPDNLAFESAAPTDNNNVAVSDPDFDAEGLVWRPGTLDDETDARFVEPDAVFEYQITAKVIDDPQAGEQPDLTGNLAKLTWVNTAGEIDFLRSQVDFSIASTPPVSLDKSVSGDNDGVVASPDELTYTVEVTNDGSEANRNDLPMTNIVVWDVLPDTVTCGEIAGVSDGGTCADEIITWTLDGPLAAGESLELTYTLTIPDNPRVAFEFTNTAGVRSFETTDNQGDKSPHFPQDNIDPAVPPTDSDVPPAHDTTTVRTVDVGLTKAQITGIIEDPNNNEADQAVIGEEITYTVTATVPPHSTVFNGVISDEMPPGIELEELDAAEARLDGEPLPGNVDFSVIPGVGEAGKVELKLGDTYENNTNTAHEFVITINARVTDVPSNTHGTSLTNTARFNRTIAPDSTELLDEIDASETAYVIEPAPAIAKTSDAENGIIHALDQVEFTLTVSNADDRPTLHDAVVEDCLPAGLSYVADSATAGYDFTAEEDACAGGGTLLTWTGLTVAADTPIDLTYSAEVHPEAAGSNTYTNTAKVSGNDLDGDTNTDGTAQNGRIYSADTSYVLTVQGATLSKETSTPTRTMGERAEFEIQVTLPQNVNFYNAVIHDALPAGLIAGSVDLVSATLDGTALDNVTQLGADGQTIGWSLGSFGSDPSERVITLNYSVLVDGAGAETPKAGDQLVNKAVFGWELTENDGPTQPGYDPQFTSNDDEATVTIIEPNLVITKAVDKTSAEIGETVAYTVEVTNDGGSPAHGTVVIDKVPAGLVVDTDSISDGGAYDSASRTITWTHPGAIEPNETVTYTYEVVLQTTADDQPNTVAIAEYHGLPEGGRKYEGPEVEAKVTPVLPLVNIEKSVQDGPAYIGESTIWTVTATSASSAAAYGVAITDTLPENWSYDSDSALVSVAGGEPMAVEPVIDADTGEMSWADLGDLTAPNQAIVITFTATPGDDAAVGSDHDHTNKASVKAHDSFGADKAPGEDGDTSYNGPDAEANTQIHAADLSITKTGAETAVAGEDHTWTITVENSGPDTAVGPFKVVDQLPAGYTAKSITGGGWTCSGASEIECVRVDSSDTLAADAAFEPIEVTVAIPADAVAENDGDAVTLENAASVTAKTHDPEEGNNDTTHTTTVSAEADLEIVKDLQTDPLVAGELATYELVVTNNGPSVHLGKISVAETVPEGTTFVDVEGTDWNFTESGAVVICDTGDADTQLAVGDSLAPIMVTVRVNSDQLDAVTNSATVTGTTPDPDEENNTSTVTNDPTTSADLQITKSHEEDELVPGTPATYVLQVYNAGPSDAQSVVVTDELAEYLTFIDAQAPSGWDCGAVDGTVTCEVPTLASGATAEIKFRVDIASSHTGDITNTAEVTSDTPDPVEENNTSTDGKDPKIVSDLGIEKSGPDTAVAGDDPITYQLTVTNHGPSDHPGPISVTDSLPAGMECLSIGGQTCSVSEASIVHSAGLVSGATFTVDVVVAVAADADLGAVENLAVVESDDETSTDPEPGNNTSTKITEILAEANVSIAKVVSGSEVIRAGEEATYILTVHNDGPSDAQNISVLDALPAGMVAVEMTGPADAQCTDSTCTLPTLAAGQSVEFTVTALVDSSVADGTDLTNTATVTTSTDGDDPADNESSADITVEAWADLALTKSHIEDSEAVAGQQTSYELLIENLGPSDAVGPLTITDELPDGFSYLSAAGGWDCESTGSNVTCTLPDGLLAGASAPTLTMLVHIAADTPEGEAINAAMVTSPTSDPNPDNNDSQVPVEVIELADVAIVKSLSGDPLIGEEITFTFEVTNSGPSVARDVVVTDEVPDDLEIIEVTSGDDWDCVVTDNQIVCELGEPLPADGQAGDITVVAEVLASAYPGVENTATVETTTPESDEENNSSTVEVPVPALVDLSIEKELTTDLLVGEEGTYLLTVTNHGPTEEPGTITVRDELPTGLMAVGASTPVGDCEIDGAIVECEISGLGVDENFEIEVQVAVGAKAYPEVTNTATVSGESTDTDEENNAAETTDPVVPLAVLNLEKTGEQDGDTIVWTLTVTNEGPNATTDAIKLTDDLPATVRFESAAGPGWSCEATGQVVECEYADPLAAGASTQMELVTTTKADGGVEITNVASVAGGVDERPSTETDDASVKVKRGLIPGLPRTGAELAQATLIALLVIALGVGVVRIARGRKA